MPVNLIFIHVGDKNISYLNDSINQATIFNKNINIYLISNKKTFNNLKYKIKKKIIFKDINKIVLKENHLNFIKYNLLDANWYNGFWKNTSERFFYLQNIVETQNLKNIIHVENDLMIYFNIKSKLKIFEKKYDVGLLLHSNVKAIPSFLYFKNLKNINEFINFFEKQHSIINKLIGLTFGKIYLKIFNKNFYSKNDMDVLYNYYKSNLTNKKINILPSSTPTLKTNKDYSKNINLSKNFKDFRGIFDPAAFGFYLDGFDRNTIFGKKKIDKKMGVLKSAVDVTKYKIYFKSFNNKKVPYILDDGKKIKLLTLHIHSKRLYKFLSK